MSRFDILAVSDIHGDLDALEILEHWYMEHRKTFLASFYTIFRFLFCSVLLTQFFFWVILITMLQLIPLLQNYILHHYQKVSFHSVNESPNLGSILFMYQETMITLAFLQMHHQSFHLASI